MGRDREYGFDNLRGLLMILVVFGHLLEHCGPFPGIGLLYRSIYSCHMPAFIFLTGYYARYDVKKIVGGLLVPYVVFQTVYILFDRWLTGEETPMQFTTPYWILWYLAACILYYLLLPAYAAESRRRQFLALGITFVLSLLAGYDRTVGYPFSLSRFLVFQPWFLLGYYCRQGGWIPAVKEWFRKKALPLGLFMTAAVCILVLLMHMFAVSPEILYGARSYESEGYGPGVRLFAGMTALAWIGFGCFALQPLLRWRQPMLTALGQNTMPVYLLHGFAVRYIQQRQPGMLETPQHVLLVAGLLLATLGNPIVGKGFRYVFSGNWILGRKAE